MWQIIGGIVFVLAGSLGILLLMDAAFRLVDLALAERTTEKMSSIPWEPGQRANRQSDVWDSFGTENQRVIIPGVFLLFVASVGLLLMLGNLSSKPDGQREMTIHLSHDVETNLNKFLNAKSQNEIKGGHVKVVGSDPIQANVRVKLELEDALVTYLKNPPASVSGTSTGVALAIVLGLVLAAAGVYLLWKILDSKHPEAAPLALVIPLAVAVFTAAPTLPRPSGGIYEKAFMCVVIIFFVVGVLLILAPFVIARPDKEPGPCLILGFSFFVLGLTTYLVGAPTPAPRPDLCPPTPISQQFLDLLTGFKPGSATVDADKLVSLRKQLDEKGPGKGDILLLLGSADCTPMRNGGNKKLAEDRAESVAKGLRTSDLTKARDVMIDTYVLPQYTGCHADQNMRAVYPLLIRSTTTVR